MKDFLQVPSGSSDTDPSSHPQPAPGFARIALASGTGEDIAAFNQDAPRSRWRISPVVAYAVVGAVLLCVLCVWAWLAFRVSPASSLVTTDGIGISESESPIGSRASPSTSETNGTGTVTVYISGAVVEPGVYTADTGARIQDFVSLAGGMTSDADDNAVNLAEEVSDGAHVIVPTRGEDLPQTADSSEQNGQGLININTATVEELDELPGIGPSLAEEIISWRESNGAYTSAEDLLNVPGLGETRVARLREHIMW